MSIKFGNLFLVIFLVFLSMKKRTPLHPQVALRMSGLGPSLMSSSRKWPRKTQKRYMEPW